MVRALRTMRRMMEGCEESVGRNKCGREVSEGGRCRFHVEENDGVKKCEQCKTSIRKEVFEKHVRFKCPVTKKRKKMEAQAYFALDLNSGSEQLESTVHNIYNGGICKQEWSQLRMKIEQLHSTIPKIESEIRKPLFKLECTDSKESKKHLIQHEAIMAHIECMCKQNSPRVLVELGAGKAELSRFVYHYAKTHLNASISLIPIDMASFRHKADTLLRSEDKSVCIERININIKDLNLFGLNSLQDDSTGIIFATKHLCGSGLDFAIRSIGSFISSRNSTNGISVAFASCCHGKCTWSTYSNQEFFTNSDFSQLDFANLCHISSWATSSFEESSPTSNAETHFLGGLSSAEKRILGRKCKDLIDHGRLLTLCSFGLDLKLIRYTTTETTPENSLFTCNCR